MLVGGERGSKKKNEKVGCVSHAMVEQLANSTMESESWGPQQSGLLPQPGTRLQDGTEPSTPDKCYMAAGSSG